MATAARYTLKVNESGQGTMRGRSSHGKAQPAQGKPPVVSQQKKGTPQKPVPGQKQLPAVLLKPNAVSTTKPAVLATQPDWLRRGAWAVAVVMLVCVLMVAPVNAAKKKKADVELEKNLEPIVKVIDDLMMKTETRFIFSPKDTGDMMKVKFQLVDMMKDNGKNALMAKPMFQTAFILAQREQFSDAYELYQYIQTTFAESPYAAQSKSELYKMKRLLGDEEYQLLVGVDPAATGAAGGTDPAKAAATPEKK